VIAIPAVSIAVVAAAPHGTCGAHRATATPVSFEENVRAALSKVALGEVDAALVYRTDTAGTDEVDAVEFPESAAAVNDYLIAVLREAPNPAGGQAFVAFVQSPAAAALLRQHGFQQP
jgi:molybdate transport system substrate-binding protein